ncbi:hypothetical protein PV395_40270, partial [Streptomyces scabiei]|nr:hypothetical protein [Streptomyces scabiei]
GGPPVIYLFGSLAGADWLKGRVRDDRPEPQQRWLPEAWNGQVWQLCGTPRRDRREAELFLTAQRRGPRPAIAYRLVQEFTDYDVTRIWGEPVRMDIEPMGNV